LLAPPLHRSAVSILCMPSQFSSFGQELHAIMGVFGTLHHFSCIITRVMKRARHEGNHQNSRFSPCSSNFASVGAG
jgi:hypothetical protein